MRFTHYHFNPTVTRVLLLLLCATVCLPSPVSARDGDDWVLVERFKDQEKKAKQGDANAMYEIGRMYERGRGIEQDLPKAVAWYERAISKDQNDARAHLGVMYFEGIGVKRDLKKAGDMILPAAKGGNPTAQFYLARMYEQGEGVNRDINQAMLWYKKAADGGHYQAVARLKALNNTKLDSAPVSQLAETPEVNTPPRAVAPTPKPAKTQQIESPARALLHAVLNTKWERNGKAPAFIPSANSTCTEKPKQVINCLSGQEQRNTGDALITYITEATLFDFNNKDQFHVEYSNTVLKVEKIERPSLTDEPTAARAAPMVKLGKQSNVHKLRCEMESVDKLVCVKNNSTTQNFTRVK